MKPFDLFLVIDQILPLCSIFHSPASCLLMSTHVLLPVLSYNVDLQETRVKKRQKSRITGNLKNNKNYHK